MPRLHCLLLVEDNLPIQLRLADGFECLADQFCQGMFKVLSRNARPIVVHLHSIYLHFKYTSTPIYSLCWRSLSMPRLNSAETVGLQGEGEYGMGAGSFE